MIMNKLQLGLVGAAVALSLVAIGGLAGPLEPRADLRMADGRPLIKVEIGGDTYTAPVFEDVVMSQARRDFERDNTAKFIRKFRDIVEMMAIKGKSHFAIGLSALGIVPMALATANEQKKLRKIDDSPYMSHRFAPKIRELLYALFAPTKSDATMGDNNEVWRRTDGLLEATAQLVAESPTGLYLDWTEMRVNGEPMLDYAAPLIRWFRENGYAREMSLFDRPAA